MEKQLTRQRLDQLKRIAKGLCPECNKPDPDKRGTRCMVCTKRHRILMRARVGCNPWREGGRGRRPVEAPRRIEPVDAPAVVTETTESVVQQDTPNGG